MFVVKNSVGSRRTEAYLHLNNNIEYRALPQLLDIGGVLLTGTVGAGVRENKRNQSIKELRR